MAFVRRLTATAACALAAHALLYRSFTPNGGAHRYLGWYEPVVGALSAVALLGLVVALLLAALSRTTRLSPPIALAPKPFSAVVGAVFSSTFVFLLVQESLERSVYEGRSAAALTPVAALAVAAAAAVAALAFALARRLLEVAVDSLLRPHARPRDTRTAAARWHVARAQPRRLRALQEHLGLRGPPYSFA